MEKLKNVFLYAHWYARTWLKPKKKVPIVPVLWKQGRKIELPTSKFIDRLDAEDKKKLEDIVKEVQMYSRLTNYFPHESFTDADWKELLECETRKHRLETLTFFRQKEKRKEADIRRDEVRKKKRAELLTEREKEPKKEFRDMIYSTAGLLGARQTQLENARLVSAYRISHELPNVIVDCRFLTKLTNRALNLTTLQLAFVNSENREREHPWPLFFSNLDATSPRIEPLKKKQLLGIFSSTSISPVLLPNLQSYKQLYPDKRLIYLSPHVEEDLERVEGGDAYIIGGIVDRVREPHIPLDASRVAAEEDGIECRRLPLDKYIKWESGSRFLTLTAVQAILHDCWATQGDWEYALRKNIPVRNLKPAEEKNPIIREKYKRIRLFNKEVLEMVEKKLGPE